MPMMPFGPSMYNPWPGVLFAVFLVLLLAGVTLLVVWLLRSTAPSAQGHDSALMILRERYARGDISRDEFDRLRNELA